MLLKQAHRVIAESNQGGLMVDYTLMQVRPPELSHVDVELVHASEAKAMRGGPVAMLAEQGRDHHVGTFSACEDELCNWEPNGKHPSPNRLDAKVWSVVKLGLRDMARMDKVLVI